MEDSFTLLAEEERSTAIVNGLTAAGIATAICLPTMMLLLAAAFFRFGHPWSRILSASKSRIFPTFSRPERKERNQTPESGDNQERDGF